MNYNETFECRYQLPNASIFIDSDNLTEEEQLTVRDMMYREDLLDLFNVQENDDFDCIIACMEHLFDQVKDFAELNECMIKAAAHVMSEDPFTGFMILYSFDYMHLTHPCIVSYLQKKDDLLAKLYALQTALNATD